MLINLSAYLFIFFKEELANLLILTSQVFRRLLSEEEANEEHIMNYEHLIKNFGSTLFEKIPQFDITPKLDVLLTITPKILSYWRRY